MAAIQQLLMAGAKPPWLYATFNPSNKAAAVTLSAGNRTAVSTDNGLNIAYTTVTLPRHKVVEFTIGNPVNVRVGGTASGDGTAGALGATISGLGLDALGQIWNADSVIASTGQTFTTGDRIAVANFDDSNTYFFKNGTNIAAIASSPSDATAAISIGQSGSGATISMDFASSYAAYGLVPV